MGTILKIMNLEPYLFVPLISKPDSLLDNAPNYLVSWVRYPKRDSISLFKDDHIWWSVFSRPLRSRFTRKQRVTTCMTLVMLSLMTCGMYYDGSPGLILDPLTSFGPLGFDARDVRCNFSGLNDVL